MPKPKKNLYKILFNLIVIGIIALAFWWIFRKIKFSDLTADFAGFNYFWLIPALAVYMSAT